MRHTKTFLTATILSASLFAAQACARTSGTSQTAAAPATPTAQPASPSSTVTPSTTATPPAAVEQQTTRPDLARYFEKFPGTFVLYDLKNDRYLRHDPERAKKRFSPYSTFKIPNSLIGLETGVVENASFRIKWDAKKYPREPRFDGWWQDHTLRSAFRNSVLWYYQEIASRVGEERMRDYVTRFRYGNQDTSGGLTRFWLGDTLKISADEQIEFLKALYKEELPVSKRTYSVFKDVFVHEQGAGYKMSAKTGGGPLRGEGAYIGWFVGYLEAKDNVYFFATQIQGPTFGAIFDERIRITKAILADLGHMPRKTSDD